VCSPEYLTIMIFSQTLGRLFEATGEYYIHGIIDGESLLGLLLPSWELSPAKTYKSLFRELMFLDRDTIITLRYDPKQGDLPLEWEATEQ